MLFYQSAWNGEMQRMRKNVENWGVFKLNGILFFSNVCTGSSCYFVALVVFLRLLTVKRPASYESMHEKLSRFGSFTIWGFSLVVWSLPLIASCPSVYDRNLYLATNFISFHVTHTIPILATVIMYFVLLWVLKKTPELSSSSSKKKKQLMTMVRGVVVGLLICNLPYIAWVGYIGAKAKDPVKGDKEFEKVFTTGFGVKLIFKCKFRGI